MSKYFFKNLLKNLVGHYTAIKMKIMKPHEKYREHNTSQKVKIQNCIYDKITGM